MMIRPRRTASIALACSLAVAVHAQQPATPPALSTIVETERAFAARATVIGWKQAFLEYFADDAVAFDGERTVRAREQLRQLPDPPAGAQLLWEPRYGDVAASGDLGWLTGPSTSINPSRNPGAPRYGNYASIWKRQRGGEYKVIVDVGTNLPMLPTFPSGFTRAPSANRYKGSDSTANATARLRSADSAVNDALQLSQAGAFAGQLSPGARLHRHDVMPLTDPRGISAWLETQPVWAAARTQFADVAASHDLGYTYGSYATLQAAGNPAQKGFYVRVWSRAADGTWQVALDVLQPQ